MEGCNLKERVTAVYFIKKGMAAKAFVNNMQTGNTKKLSAQIKKGTVKVHKVG